MATNQAQEKTGTYRTVPIFTVVGSVWTNHHLSRGTADEDPLKSETEFGVIETEAIMLSDGRYFTEEQGLINVKE